MKKLILVRHSKAAKGLEVADIDRYLTQEGVERAYKISKGLKNKLKFVPEFWLTSPGNRALHTATIFGQVFNTCENIKIEPHLYTFNKDELLYIINRLPISVDSAILFGHNDAFFEVVNSYSKNYIHDFKPCSVAVINIKEKRWDATENAAIDFILNKDNIDE